MLKKDDLDVERKPGFEESGRGLPHLTTIGGPWYFDRASVPQRLINQLQLKTNVWWLYIFIYKNQKFSFSNFISFYYSKNRHFEF